MARVWQGFKSCVGQAGLVVGTWLGPGFKPRACRRCWEGYQARLEEFETETTAEVEGVVGQQLPLVGFCYKV